MEEAALRKPDPGRVAALYSIVVVLFLFIGSRVQQREFYSGVLITEFLLILAPAAIFLAVYNYDIRKVLRLNKIRPLNLLLIFFIMLCSIPVVGVFNLANLFLVKVLFGRILLVQPPVAQTFGQMVLGVLIIGGSAGICEETLFRGVIQRSLEDSGKVKAILVTSLLFGLMHIDFQKLLGTFLLGSLIGFIVYRTGSIFGGMFAHFVNNSSAVVMTFLSNRFMKMLQESGFNTVNTQARSEDFFNTFSGMPPAQLAGVIIGWIFITLFFGAILTGLFIAFLRVNDTRFPQGLPGEAGRYGTAGQYNTAGQYGMPGEAGSAPRGRRKAAGLLLYLPGLVLICFVYLYEGLKLRGISIEFVDSLIKLFKI